MNYQKIIRIATECSNKQVELNSLYQLVGGNKLYENKEIKDIIYDFIEEKKKELERLEISLRKEIKEN